MSEKITAKKLFEQVLEWFRSNYGSYEFFVERDLVWVIQQKVKEIIVKDCLPFEVYNDFPIVKVRRRSLTTDLAILNKQNEVELAIEFKYEPDHQRRDIWSSKLSPSVVFWGKEGVKKDVEKAKQYVDQKKAKLAITIFVDEGGLFRHRKQYPNTKWVDWNSGGKNPRKISLLIGYFT